MIELPWLDVLGWVGFVCIGLFYWLVGSGKVMQAYMFSIVGCIAWMSVGIASWMGYAAQLPSLITMEILIIGLNIRGIWKWRNVGAKE